MSRGFESHTLRLNPGPRPQEPHRKDACERTHHIEEASELEAAWFASARRIGITAGASTPQEHIERAVARIKELYR